MIEVKNGRTRSVRTPEEVEALLAQDIKRLSKEEREVLDLILKELKGEIVVPEGESTLLASLNQAEYKTPPVDMRTFVTDPYFLGQTCDMIYPKLLDDLVALFEGDYQEAVITGAIGIGKTFLSSIGLCRILYEISCLKDPHASYGIARGSNISIVTFSVTADLARKVAFENIATKIKSSPYFQDHFPFEATKTEFRFPGNVWLAPRATTNTSALGLNVIAAMLDEANDMPVKVTVAGREDMSETIYTAIKRRMESRFKRGGKLPGIFFIVSSKKTTEDFTAKRISSSINDPGIFVIDYSNWEIRDDLYAKSKRFHVLCGTADVGSKILNEKEYLQVKDNVPEGAVIVDVPEDFRASFEANLEESIRDIAGIATVSVRPYIQRREKIREAIKPGLEHPFSTEWYDMSKGGTFLWDRMVKLKTVRGPGGTSESRLLPIVNPTAHRHLHVDLGLRKDAMGICMSHISGWKEVERRTEDNRIFKEQAPIYRVDFILRVVPPIGGEIIIGEARHLIYDLIAHGYSITCVSFDSWQSVDSIQQLQAKGVNAVLESVDTKPEPYDSLKMALYENRVEMYEYPILMKELSQLQEDLSGRQRKIDHPTTKGSSKDTSDALAGCLWTLSQHKPVMPIPIITTGTAPLPGAWTEEQQMFRTQGNMPNMDMPLPPFIMTGGGKGGWDW